MEKVWKLKRWEAAGSVDGKHLFLLFKAYEIAAIHR